MQLARCMAIRHRERGRIVSALPWMQMMMLVSVGRAILHGTRGVERFSQPPLYSRRSVSFAPDRLFVVCLSILRRVRFINKDASKTARHLKRVVPVV
jgi:hypothetical protein